MADSARALPSAFIFDCDGSLLRSMGMWIQVQGELLASYGIETTPDDFAQFESLSMMGECCAYHDTWGVGANGQEVYDKLMAMLLERYRAVVPVRPGVASFLEAVREAGIPMAIATSTPEPAVRCGLAANGLAGYFDIIVTTGEAGASKDQPDVYNLALERLCAARGIDVPGHERVWVFEDAVFGLKSSGAAGYRRVGIFDAEGRSARPDVQANCEIFIDEFSDLALEDVCAWGAR